MCLFFTTKKKAICFLVDILKVYVFWREITWWTKNFNGRGGAFVEGFLDQCYHKPFEIWYLQTLKVEMLRKNITFSKILCDIKGMNTHGFGHTWMEKKPSQTWRPLTSHRKNILQRPICLEGIQVSIVKGISEGFKELYSKKWSEIPDFPSVRRPEIGAEGVPQLVFAFQESKSNTPIEFWPKKHNKNKKKPEMSYQTTNYLSRIFVT